MWISTTIPCVNSNPFVSHHVFAEKPIATELDETVEAINACNEAGVKLMIGLQRRFDENFRRVRKAVENKEVGQPIMIKLCSRDPAPPPASYVKGGGGIFADMGKCHFEVPTQYQFQYSQPLFDSFSTLCRPQLSMTWTCRVSWLVRTPSISLQSDLVTLTNQLLNLKVRRSMIRPPASYATPTESKP